MSAHVKGWCPGALAPMRSGDGLIVRLRLSCGELSVARAREIADCSRQFGNGEIDLTARAHLQLRGVGDAAYPALIERLAASGLIDASPEVEAVRNVLVTPFAGLDGALDVRPHARAWEQALAASPELRRLPGKFGVAFDAGGFPMGDDSDIRFEARGDGQFVARLAGAHEVLGAFPVIDLVAVARALAGAFLALADAPRRMREAVQAHGLAPFAAATGLPVASAPRAPRAPAAEWLGAHALEHPHRHREERSDEAIQKRPLERSPFDHGTAGLLRCARNDGGSTSAFVGVAAPFGRLRASQLAALAQAAGPAGMRLTPWRALLIPCDDPAARARTAHDLGLIVDPADPLLRVAACVGAPACESALQETREAARRLAAFAPRGEGIWLHVSGCAKGCAHPRPAPMTVVAGREGYQLNGEAPRGLDALAERIVA